MLESISVFLYWWVVAAIFGAIAAFVLPLRRLWLILPVGLLAAALWVGPALLGRGGSLGYAFWMSVLIGTYLVFWAVGVHAGWSLRRRLWRHMRRRATVDPPVT